jgi:hypothetical protein
MAKLMVIKRPSRNCGGRAGKAVVLIRGDLTRSSRSSRSASTRRSATRGSSAPSSLTKQSTNFATPSIEDYAERNAAQREFWEGQNGKQAGDPAKLAQALLTVADEEQPPRRFIAGADAIAQAEQKVAQRQDEIDAFRELSTSLARDDVATSA